MKFSFDQRPVIVAIAGRNGAGRSTFYDTYIARSKLFLSMPTSSRSQESCRLAKRRKPLAKCALNFVARRREVRFETVLADPVGEKVDFLNRAVAQGDNIVFFLVGVGSAAISHNRVRTRVSRGGHGVPQEKLDARYPRTMANLARAIKDLPSVFVFDNSDLQQPYRLLAEYRSGRLIGRGDPWPKWFMDVVQQGPND